jgi:hypothetical protein
MNIEAGIGAFPSVKRIIAVRGIGNIPSLHSLAVAFH